MRRVDSAGGEVERAVESGERTGESDEHLSERRMDVEEECSIEVVCSEFTEMGLFVRWSVASEYEGKWGLTSSQTTELASPIRYNLVNNERTV